MECLKWSNCFQNLGIVQRKILQGMLDKIILNLLTGMNLVVKWHILANVVI